MRKHLLDQGLPHAEHTQRSPRHGPLDRPRAVHPEPVTRESGILHSIDRESGISLDRSGKWHVTLVGLRNWPRTHCIVVVEARRSLSGTPGPATASNGQQRPATAAVSSEGSQLCRWATWSYPSVCRRLLGDRACRLIRRRTLALAARTRGLGHRNSNQGYVVGSGYRAVAVADAAVAIAVRWSQGALLVLA